MASKIFKREDGSEVEVICCLSGSKDFAFYYSFYVRIKSKGGKDFVHSKKYHLGDSYISIKTTKNQEQNIDEVYVSKSEKLEVALLAHDEIKPILGVYV